MICVVPLAGADIVRANGCVKPLSEVDGTPLIERVLTSRPWWRDGVVASADLIFVLRADVPESAAIARFLDRCFVGAQKAYLNSPTRGALLSAVAGVSASARLEEPLCIDLADIIYDADAEQIDVWLADADSSGLIPWFRADDACYSYLAIDARGRVTATAEKRVISEHASAGTYFFRDVATFLEAAAFSIREQRRLAVSGNLFVCPSFNGLTQADRRVDQFEVKNVNPVSKLFRSPAA